MASTGLRHRHATGGRYSVPRSRSSLAGHAPPFVSDTPASAGAFPDLRRWAGGWLPLRTDVCLTAGDRDNSDRCAACVAETGWIFNYTAPLRPLIISRDGGAFPPTIRICVTNEFNERLVTPDVMFLLTNRRLEALKIEFRVRSCSSF